MILERRGFHISLGCQGRSSGGKAQFYWFKETRGQSLGLQEEMEIEGNSKKEKAIREEP